MCISNYCFSGSSPLGRNYYHSTSFRGFPGKKKGHDITSNAMGRTAIKSITEILAKYFNTGHCQGGKNSGTLKNDQS